MAHVLVRISDSDMCRYRCLDVPQCQHNCEEVNKINIVPSGAEPPNGARYIEMYLP